MLLKVLNLDMKKILIVDDNHDLRNLTIEALELEGYHAIGAENGTQGISLAKEAKPDIIFCDIMMPETDGYEVYENLKQNSSTSLTPFVFITALAEKEHIRKGMEIGADDYITKPFTLKDLIKTINTRIQKSEVINSSIEVKLNELRDSIIRNLPHELLTPLHGILGFTSILTDESILLNRSEIREMATHLELSGKRLNDLINNFLSYVRITSSSEAENIPVELEGVDHIIADISTNVAIKYKRPDDLILDLERAELNIVDEDFVFIIRELVDNAFKFSEPKSNVIVMCKKRTNSLEIRITDHGMGFPIDNFKEIGAFNQFDRKKYEQQGAGLGLITSMLIVQRYHGSLSITNDNLGATVLLKLPV